MKRFIKMLMVTCVAALALAAVMAAGASASTFTATATGKIKGSATTEQVFTVGGANVVKCKKAATTGEIKSTESAEQHVTVNYSECSATFFGFPAGTITISPATYNFTANGEVHILNTITIHSAGLNCDTVVTPQTRSSVTYTTKTINLVTGIESHTHVTAISSESSNGCPSGTAGTYTGSNLTEREGGGSISWDA